MPAALLAVQVYSPASSRRTGEKLNIPWNEGRTLPPSVQVMVGVGSPLARQVRMYCVFSRTVLLLTRIVGGTAWGNMSCDPHVM